MGQKYSTNRGKFNEIAFWLVFDAWGGVRLTRGEPDLKNGERGMAVKANIPHSLFNIPQLRCDLNVSAPDSPPIQIDTDAAAEALKMVVGADINVTVRQSDPAE